MAEDKQETPVYKQGPTDRDEVRDQEKPDTPDDPVTEWPAEVRYKVAHSDDAPAKDDPGCEEDEQDHLKEGGFIKREMDEHSELEGQGETVHDMDAGVTDENRIGATPAAMGVPKPTDLADDRTEATIDVNSASEEELCQLRGVAEDDAKEIVAYREEHGPFESINDLVDLDNFARSRVATLARQGAYAGKSGGNGSRDEGDHDEGDSEGHRNGDDS